jgi:hypothetical protein
MPVPTTNSNFAALVTHPALTPAVLGSGVESSDRLGDGGAAAQLVLRQRIAAVLAGAGVGFGCQQLRLDVLDGATTRLVTSGSWGLPAVGSKSRLLADARADVAAMSGSAVVLDDAESLAAWPVPVDGAAAICLPVASDTTIHGTLWLSFAESRSFADAELGLMEIVAGRLALELDRLAELPGPPAVASVPASAAHVVVKSTPTKPQLSLLPTQSPVLDELELAGWSLDRDRVASFYDWHPLADGRMLVVAASQAQGVLESPEFDGHWLQAARIALRVHASQCQDAGELLTIANDTLWTASPGGQGLSLAVALIDSGDATGSLALAGNATAVRWRAGGCTPVVAESSPVGWHQSSAYLPRECSLVVRERLLLTTLGSRVSRIDRLCRELVTQPAEAQRRMHARGALRVAIEAASDHGCDLRSAALVRRR